MFRIHKKVFIRLLTSIITASNHTKFVSLNNQQFMTQPALINIHPYEYNQGFFYSPFTINLDRHIGISNTLNRLSNKACVPNKPEDLNISIFNTIT